MSDRFTPIFGNRRGSGRTDRASSQPPAEWWWAGLRDDGIDGVELADWFQACHDDGCAVLNVEPVGVNQWRLSAQFTAVASGPWRQRVVSARSCAAILDRWPHGEPDGDHGNVAGPLLSA